YREGDIRLVGGPHNWEGRVEIFWNGTWGTISDSQWTNEDASVIRRQLQHMLPGYAMPCCDDESGDNSSSQIAPHFGSVICTGKENNITECSYSTQNISAQQDIGVHCQQGNQAREGEIRLVEGDSPWEGRVEIHLSREWGTISDAEYYDSREATVVCRQLGYNFYNARSYCCARFGEGSGQIKSRYISCKGIEHRITNCSYNTHLHQEDHSDDWSVSCDIGDCESGRIRLAGGDTEREGRVEICINGEWGTVCGKLWMKNNTNVVCRYLGFSDTYDCEVV
ncbi:Neurotrypsin, partial [Geodia barretti]